MNSDCRSIVLEYLLHNCYKNTAKAFLEEQIKLDTCGSLLEKNTADKQKNLHNKDMKVDNDRCEVNGIDARWIKLDARKELYCAVESGDIPRAFDIIRKHFPALMADNQESSDNGNTASKGRDEETQTVLFKLRCQQFVEIVRNSTVAEAIEFGQMYLKPMEKRYRAMIDETASVIAFANPYDSKAKYLLTDEHRSSLADEVNRIVLAQCNLPAEAAMETIYKQEQVIKQELAKVERMRESSDREKMSV